MSAIERFLPRIQNLPAYLRLRPGYTVVEEQSGQFLLHSGSHSFKVSVPFPGIGLIQFLEQLSGKRPLANVLESLPPFHINFLLDVTETLHRSGLLIAGQNGTNGAGARYVAAANLFDQFQQLLPENTLQTFLSEQMWQECLSAARIGLIGLGRIGSQVARQLTIVGLQDIRGIDEGLVDESLRYTDAWYNESDQGKERGKALGHNLRVLNPETRFSSLSTSLSELENDNFPQELLEVDLVVAATDRLRTGLYERVNSFCVQAGIPWTSYRPNWSGLTIEIGPTVLPKETACYTCYQHRRRSNLADPEREHVLAKALEGRRAPLLDIQLTPCLSLFCYEILRLLSGRIRPFALNAIMEFNMAKAELVQRPLLKVPRCPTCRRDIQPFSAVRFWSELAVPNHEKVGVRER